MAKLDPQTIFLASVVIAGLGVGGYALLTGRAGDHDPPPPAIEPPVANATPTAGGAARRKLSLDEIPFNGRRAFDMLKKICDIGPRMSGSPGMARQQQLLADHFKKLGGKVSFQRFRTIHPVKGTDVPLANLVVEWHPERKERILLCAHYDTRPYPDRDPDPARRRDPFIGANDGASGVAVLAELAHHMPALKGRYGVDFVLFDAEEFCFFNDRTRDIYFLGSEHFAKQYKAGKMAHNYKWGVLLDMVGDADLALPFELNSYTWPDTRPLAVEIWRTAWRLGVHDFKNQLGQAVDDDHVPLRNIGGIPTIDIIDFQYGHWVRGPQGPVWQSYWHTTADTPDKCSALSLAKVGWVVREWLKGVK